MRAQIEPWAIVQPELPGLIDLHWQELALNKDKVPLAPQWDVYRAMDEAGQLCVVTLRDGVELIGYILMSVAPGLHYATCLTAIMDILYVRPDRRDAGCKGVLLMLDALEAELKARGVQRWFMGTKLHKDIGAVFRRRGFEPVETSYSKWIGA